MLAEIKGHTYHGDFAGALYMVYKVLVWITKGLLSRFTILDKPKKSILKEK